MVSLTRLDVCEPDVSDVSFECSNIGSLARKLVEAWANSSPPTDRGMESTVT